MQRLRELICSVFGHKEWPARFCRAALASLGVNHCRRCHAELWKFD